MIEKFSKKYLILAGLVVIVIGVLLITIIPGISAPKEVYNGKYMSIEYPKDWKIIYKNITTAPEPIGTFETIDIKNKSGKGEVLVFAFENTTTDDVKSRVSQLSMYENMVGYSYNETIGGIAGIGGVKCVIYENYDFDDDYYLITYIFQKEGRTFMVVCPPGAVKVAEEIIKTAKTK